MPDEDFVRMRPYVQIATICQSPIQETSGFLSLFRITDRLPLQGPTDEMQPQPLFGLFIVVILKSGEIRGEYKWHIVTNTPSGEQQATPEASALFEGDERGVAFVSPLMVVATEPGLYWFDVMFGPELLTRIPLRVMYQKVPQMPGTQFPPQDG